jgi:hypothetical protein
MFLSDMDMIETSKSWWLAGVQTPKDCMLTSEFSSEPNIVAIELAFLKWLHIGSWTGTILNIGSEMKKPESWLGKP